MSGILLLSLVEWKKLRKTVNLIYLLYAQRLSYRMFLCSYLWSVADIKGEECVNQYAASTMCFIFSVCFPAFLLSWHGFKFLTVLMKLLLFLTHTFSFHSPVPFHALNMHLNLADTDPCSATGPWLFFFAFFFYFFFFCTCKWLWVWFSVISYTGV